jgi:hypothetical protein
MGLDITALEDCRLYAFSYSYAGYSTIVIEKARFHAVTVVGGESYPVAGVAEKIYLSIPKELRAPDNSPEAVYKRESAKTSGTLNAESLLQALGKALGKK